MFFLALAAGGAAALEVHRALHKGTSDPMAQSMLSREKELKDALTVRFRSRLPLQAIYAQQKVLAASVARCW